MSQGSTAEQKHLTVIRARLRDLLRELRGTHDPSQAAVAEVNYLLIQLGESKDPEVTGRPVTLEQLRMRLASVPGASVRLKRSTMRYPRASTRAGACTSSFFS